MDSSDLIAWRPVARRVSFAEQDVLAPLARAFDMKIHEDICTYFSAYWSGGLEATCEFGAVSLLLLWNEEDAVRLIENQIGHVLAQRRARAPLTVFFACGATDTDDIYSVDNHSGCVMLEQPGRKPLQEIAPDLATFIAALEPAPASAAEPLI